MEQVLQLSPRSAADDPMAVEPWGGAPGAALRLLTTASLQSSIRTYMSIGTKVSVSTQSQQQHAG